MIKHVQWQGNISKGSNTALFTTAVSVTLNNFEKTPFQSLYKSTRALIKALVHNNLKESGVWSFKLLK